MLNKIIHFSLNNRALILILALIAVCAGLRETAKLPIDVMPDLSRPRVVIITECRGMAPEEVETLVTMPVEMYLNGATGITSLRSNSTSGLSMITVEFEWGTDPFRCRQVVEERLQMSAEMLPDGVTARMVPLGSMMGKVMLLSIWDENEQLTPMELRTLGEWTFRRQLLGAGGIAEILVMGGDVEEFQIRPRLEDLQRFGVTVCDIEKAVQDANSNVTGGIVTLDDTDDYLVRGLGRITKLEDFESVVVKGECDPPVLLPQVADIVRAPAVKLGSSATWTRDSEGKVQSRPSIILSVERQLGQDTRKMTEAILASSDRILASLHERYPGLRVEPVYEQETFIQLAVNNVMEALWVGALLVVVVLVMFLMNLRATLITVVAMPLSILMTCLCFAWFGMSINTMTLGGIAVAIGELVDDAIVDVENIFRRLRENFRREERIPILTCVFEASSEIRNSIVNGTLVVMFAFLPVFFLSGMEGKMFAPLGIAYVVSLAFSLLVSLTVTPVLAALLLPKSAERHREREGYVLRGVKWVAERAIRFSLRFPRFVTGVSLLLVVGMVGMFLTLERDFMPPFNEGAPTVNVLLPPGKSLEVTARYTGEIASQLMEIPGVTAVVRQTGRSEMDDHAVPVNMSQLVCTLDLKSERPIQEIFHDIEAVIAAKNVPGLTAYYDQPLQHLIGHLRSGATSQIAIKVRGENPQILRKRALEIQKLIRDIPGVGMPRIEPVPQDIAQLKIVLDRERLAYYGLAVADVNHTVETLLYGKTATQVLDGIRTIDAVVRLDETLRQDWERLGQFPLALPDGGTIPLSAVVTFDRNATGPSRIAHEAAMPQVMIETNPRGRGATEVQRDIQARLAPHWAELTDGNVHIETAGLFQSERESTRKLLILSGFSMVGIFMILFRMFGSVNIVLQILSALPIALFGAILAIVISGQDRTVPNLVGMISLCGIATRNGILLLDHYFHLMKFEGQTFGKDMIVRAGRDRTAPVLMTALTSSLGLIPLTLSPSTPGREILYPIATVVVGGLFTSTLMEFFTRPALFWLFGRKIAELKTKKEEK